MSWNITGSIKQYREEILDDRDMIALTGDKRISWPDKANGSYIYWYMFICEMCGERFSFFSQYKHPYVVVQKIFDNIGLKYMSLGHGKVNDSRIACSTCGSIKRDLFNQVVLFIKDKTDGRYARIYQG